MEPRILDKLNKIIASSEEGEPPIVSREELLG